MIELQVLQIIILLTLSLMSVAIAGLMLLNARRFYRSVLRGISKPAIVVLAALFVLNICVSFLYPEVTVTNNDEFYYARYAKSISGLSMEEITSHNSQPLGFMFLLSIVFSVFGSSLKYVYALNLLLGALSVLAIFFVSYLLFRREDIGLYSAAFMSVLPMNILVSNSMGMYSAPVFFSLLTVAGFLFSIRARTYISGLLAVLLLAFTAYMRLEFVALAVPVAVLVLIYDRELRGRWMERLMLAFIYILFVLPELLYIYILENRDFSPYFLEGTRDIFSLSFVPKNLSVFIYTVLGNGLLLALLILGAVYMILSYRKEFVFILSWMATFSVVYLSYWAFHMRYVLIIYVIMAVIWSVGIGAVQKGLSRFSLKGTMNLLVGFAVLVAACSSFIPFYIEEPPLGKNNYYFLLGLYANYYLDSSLKGCTFISTNPLIYVGENIETVDINDVVKSPDIVADHEGCLLYIDDVFCEVDIPVLWKSEPGLRDKCRMMEDSFILEPYIRINITIPERMISLPEEELKRSWTFTLYNVSLGG